MQIRFLPFWLMIVSIAMAVLPVWRSPMISSRWPRPIGIIESMALMPVWTGVFTFWRLTTSGAMRSTGRNSVVSIGPLPSIGWPTALTTRPIICGPTGHRHDAAGAAHRLPFGDAGWLTHDDDADVVGLEVEDDAQHAVLELHHFGGARVVQAADTRDAVADLDHGAHFHRARRRLEAQDLLLELADQVVCAYRHERILPSVKNSLKRKA